MTKGKIRRRMFVIAFTAIIATLFSQTSLAYYATSGTATNVITTGDVHIAIIEKMDNGQDFPKEGVYIMPGSIVSKIVTVANTGSHPCWVRVKLTNGVTNEALSGDIFDVNINNNDWITGTDGYYYYKAVVEPGETTQKLFSQVRIAGDIDNSYAGENVTLTVCAFAVQSENNPADSPLNVSGWPSDGGKV